MRDRIVKSVFWMAWSRVLLQGVSFASTIVVARILSPTDYGLMALAGIWTGIVILLAEFGLGAAIVQFRDLSDRELNSCFWLMMSVASVGYAMLCEAAPFIAVWFGAPRLSAVLRVAGLTLPLVCLRVVPDGLLRQRIELDLISRAEVAAGLVTIPVVLAMASAGAGVWALVAGGLAGPLVQSAVTFAYVRWRPGFRVGGERVRQILRYSLAMLGSRISWALYEQADAFVLGKVSGDAALGFYSMAKNIALLPVEKMSGAVNQLVTPVMAELQADREGLRKALLKSVRLVACIAFPLCIGLMLVGRDLVEVVLTDKWISSVPIIQVLCMYALVRSVAVLLPSALMAQYRSKFLFAYSAVQLIMMPVAFLAGAAMWGALGVAIAWVTVYPITLTRLTHEVVRAVEISYEILWSQIRWPVVATVVMAVSVFAARWSLDLWREDLRLARVVLLVATGVTTYSTVLFTCGGSTRDELLEALSCLFRRGPAPTVGE